MCDPNVFGKKFWNKGLRHLMRTWCSYLSPNKRVLTSSTSMNWPGKLWWHSTWIPVIDHSQRRWWTEKLKGLISPKVKKKLEQFQSLLINWDKCTFTGFKRVHVLCLLFSRGYSKQWRSWLLSPDQIISVSPFV